MLYKLHHCTLPRLSWISSVFRELANWIRSVMLDESPRKLWSLYKNALFQGTRLVQSCASAYFRTIRSAWNFCPRFFCKKKKIEATLFINFLKGQLHWCIVSRHLCLFSFSDQQSADNRRFYFRSCTESLLLQCLLFSQLNYFFHDSTVRYSLLLNSVFVLKLVFLPEKAYFFGGQVAYLT